MQKIILKRPLFFMKKTKNNLIDFSVYNVEMF